jgi:phage tail-like protein
MTTIPASSGSPAVLAPPTAATNGALTAPSNGAMTSSYVEYLPAPYAADPFLGRFLMIVETIFSSIERTVDNVPYYFDPATVPEEMLAWLASWVGVELDENAPVETRRRVLAKAAGLYRWQGTRRALREQLEDYTGQRPLIVENFDGLRLGGDAMLGINTQLGQARPHSMYITALTDDAGELDEGVLRRIVDAEKPVHVGYTLEVRQHNPAPVRINSPLSAALPEVAR